MRNVIYRCEKGHVLKVKMKVLNNESKLQCDSVQEKKKKHVTKEHT